MLKLEIQTFIDIVGNNPVNRTDPSGKFWQMVAVIAGAAIFTWHGEYRSKLRKRVNDLEVLTILKSKGRRHEARKDKLEINRTEVRISLSFDCDFSVIITVINLDEES